MPPRPPRKPRPALDPASLDELALAYVGRFATTRFKLAAYLRRKLRERGWNGPGDADVDSLVERFAGRGFVDDSAFAAAKARTLTGRGYGPGRVRQSLRAAGIGEDDSAAATDIAEDARLDSAMRFARKRRIGPFAAVPPDRPAREKAIAAMIRAGHDFDIARRIVALDPGASLDSEGE